MTDQKQAPERYDGGGCVNPSGYLARYIDYAALAKQRDELTAENERMKSRELMIVSHATMGGLSNKGVIDKMSVNDISCKITAARNDVFQAGKDSAANQARAASAAREIAMRDRAAEVSLHWLRIYPASETRKSIALSIRALPLSPDGQQALDDVRAKEWDAGYRCKVLGRVYSSGSENPHRKPSDAGKSEDRG